MNNIADENNNNNNNGENKLKNNNNNNNNILKEVTVLSPPNINNNINNENSNNTPILSSPDSINGAQVLVNNNNNNNNNSENVNNNQQQQPQQPTSNIIPKSKTTTKTQFKITQFSQRDKAFYTETRVLLDLTWKLYIFPRGNTSDRDIALFLHLNDVSNPTPSNQNLEIKAHFTLEIVNQKNSENSIRKVSDHRFESKSVDWGFNKFMDIQQLTDPDQGFVVNDTIIINVEVFQAYPCSTTYDSKKITGYVGLQNQGATCYMNSLLQALFHISPFRRAVYELPTVSDDPTKSISLALQRIFYKLQFGDKSVPTKELTKSFGWDTMDIFTQHDVQELNRVLCDNLNDKMKGTKAEGTVDDLFRGKIKNFIKCEKVSFESKSDEYFYDLSLNVKGCRDIIASFDKYTETERLDGSNQYFAEGFGLQNANKGVKFLSLPPVLNLHLKRFEYDPIRDENVKINDKYKFPDTLDLNCYLDESADKSISHIYTLQSVLIHAGDLHNGHYYAFIKSKDGDWLKFDDDEVTKSTFDRVSDASFGSDFGVRSGRSDTNAYMLVYFRNNCYDSLTRVIEENEIPEHLKTRIERDEMKENEQTFQLKLTRDEDFIHHKSYDLLDLDRFPSKAFKKTHDHMNIGHLKKQITTMYGIPVERQRIWSWTTRRNRTQRIERYPETDDTLLHTLRLRMNNDFRLHLEICFNPRPISMNGLNSGGGGGNYIFSGNNQLNGGGGGGGNINNNQSGGNSNIQNQQQQQQQHLFNDNSVNSFFPKITKENETNALLFFKYYDPEAKTLKFLGSKVIDIGTKASNVFPQLCQLAELPVNTPLLVFEEITSSNIQPIKPNEILAKNDMISGDILVFQKQIASPHKLSLPTVIDYYQYIVNTIVVKFKQVDNSQIQFNYELSKQMKYSDITAKIASTIGANAENIRLMSKTRNESPPTPVKPNDNIPLYDMLTNTNKIPDLLYFEILNIPVKDCEIKRNFKITWQKPNSNEVEIISVWVLKIGDVKELIKEFLNTIKNNFKQQQQQLQQQQTTATNQQQQIKQQPNGVVINSNTNSNSEQTTTTTNTTNELIDIENLDSSRIRIIEIRGYRVERVLTDEDVSSINEISLLRAEIITDEEMNPVNGEKVVFVVHYSREHNYPMFHGTPFGILYKPGESCQSLRSRIHAKLGGSVSSKEFSRWKISIIKNDKVEYIPEDCSIGNQIDWSSGNMFIGLEHQNNHNKTHQQKAIKILG